MLWAYRRGRYVNNLWGRNNIFPLLFDNKINVRSASPLGSTMFPQTPIDKSVITNPLHPIEKPL